MKKAAIICMLVGSLLVLSAVPASANTAAIQQDYGAPGTETLVLEEDCPVTVQREILLFDLRDTQPNSGAGAVVEASYFMHNPTQEEQKVRMAFPYIAPLKGFQAEDIHIKAGGVSVPFEIRVSPEMMPRSEMKEKLTAGAFDIGQILGNDGLNGIPYQPTQYRPEEQGHLYLIQCDNANAKLRVWGAGQRLVFGGMVVEQEEDQSYYCSLYGRGSQAYIYSLDGPIRWEMAADKDGSVASADEVEISPEKRTAEQFIAEYLAPSYEVVYGFSHQSAIQYCEMILDKGFFSGAALSPLWANEYTNQCHIMLLLYEVTFPPDTEVKLEVSYPSTLFLAADLAQDDVFEMVYLLNPAKYWADFGELEIMVQTPDFAPYLLNSSLTFEEVQAQEYKATLAALPNEDLSFEIYAKPQRSGHEQTEAQRRELGQALIVTIYLVLPIVAVIAVVLIIVLAIRAKNKRKAGK